jgi:hypothetical protein
LEELTDAPKGYFTSAPAQIVAMPTPKAESALRESGGERGIVVNMDRSNRF